MKTFKLLFPLLFAATLASCGGASDTTITVAASELPHAKILKEAIAPILKEKGYDLKVTVLEWTQQNPAVARGEYDANYFQHLPYLETYNKDAGKEGKLRLVAKAHFERLCLYTSDLKKTEVTDGSTIELVNDLSNIERALLLLEDNHIITSIKDSCYDAAGNFVNFDVTKPTEQVLWAPEYEHCKLTCIQESNLAISLGDYDFGILPGNAALTGLGDDYARRIVAGERVSEETLSLRANGVAVRPENVNSPKTKALVEAFGNPSVKEYISDTFGESVLYHYEKLID